jgi:hypothetical protein
MIARRSCLELLVDLVVEVAYQCAGHVKNPPAVALLTKC